MKNISFLLIFLITGIFFTVSCTKEAQTGSTASAEIKIDLVSPGFASANTVLTITGTGLGDIRSIIFDSGNVAASLNPNFNTNSAVIFRVPADAIPAKQNIILTNGLGKQIVIPFNVLGLPTILEVSNYNFTSGTRITLTGKNLDDVSKVVLNTTQEALTVVSKTKTSVQVAFPAGSTTTRSTLSITNTAGTITTTQEFINMDKAFKIFTDQYDNGLQNASWGSDAFISTTVFKSGTASVGKTYAAGNWHQMGFGWNQIANDNYTFLTFWIKGGTADYPLWISTATSPGGFASFNEFDKINVPKNVWTYFKLPVSTLNLWATGTSFNQIGWRIQGPNGDDQTFYLDDVMFVK